MAVAVAAALALSVDVARYRHAAGVAFCRPLMAVRSVAVAAVALGAAVAVGCDCYATCYWPWERAAACEPLADRTSWTCWWS